MRKLKPLYVGQVFSTTKCGNVEVIHIKDRRKITVRFLDTENTMTTTFDNLSCGEIRDIMRPSLYGVGIVGTWDRVGKDREYDLWHSMLRRCYGVKELTRNPTYIGCSVSEDFKEYLKFKTWCNDQIGFSYSDTNSKHFHLDKDLLVKGNKVYSPDTCCFIPCEINALFTHIKKNKGAFPVGVNFCKASKKFRARVYRYGRRHELGLFSTVEEAFLAYKEAKETYIKEVAEKWKDQIDPKVYEALMKYEVEITD